MHTLKYRAYIKSLKRFAKGYETILYHHQCNMEPSWTVNISPEEYYGDEDLVVEEFTGLFDRNGKEIYEGDIVKFVFYRKDRIGKVVFDFIPDSEGFYIEKHYGWGIWCDDNFNTSLGDYADDNMRCEGIEIIGNIHENPELVGEVDDEA